MVVAVMGLISTRRSAKKEGSSKARAREGRTWLGQVRAEQKAAKGDTLEDLEEEEDEERGGKEVLRERAR